MRHSTRKYRWLLPAFASLCVTMLAACGGASYSSTPKVAAKPAAGTPPATSSSRVTATETEYKIVLSSATLKPGSYTFVAINKGSIPHSLAINGPGVSNKQIAGTIAPGASGTLTVILQKGSYDVYCPVSGHKALGMDTKVTVQ